MNKRSTPETGKIFYIEKYDDRHRAELKQWTAD